MKKFLMPSRLRSQRGVTAIVVALLMFAFLGFAAIAIDFGHLYVTRNELKNASDAGALAGAQVLYNADGTAINVGANQTAHDIATANKSEGTAVEVNLNGNTGDVQRGHWSFGTGLLPRGFKENPSTVPIGLWGVSDEDLDGNPDFINAVRVKTRRETTPAASFFARIFGYENFKLSQESVAYIGFAGPPGPGEVDQPIAICKQSILVDDEYKCNVGRMISDNTQTGGWTDFNQEDNPCNGGTNNPAVKALVCGAGNPKQLTKAPMAMNNGMLASTFASLEACWAAATGKTKPWGLMLPVIDCADNITTCNKVVGAVNLNVILVVTNGYTSGANAYNEVPDTFEAIPGAISGDPGYAAWNASGLTGFARWKNFAQHFKLQAANPPVSDNDFESLYRHFSIYFLPDCTHHDLVGGTGGDNFGVLAKIPVLVE